VANRVRLIAAISLVYDGLVGIAMIAARPLFARLFGVPLPVPPIHADLNGVFLIAVALGYLIPYRDPDHGRGYLWVMGVFLKSAGAAAFLLDYFIRHSPASFLVFAASDGALAVASLWALLPKPRR